MIDLVYHLLNSKLIVYFVKTYKYIFRREFDHDAKIAKKSLKILTEDMEISIINNLLSGRIYISTMEYLNQYEYFHKKIENEYFDKELQDAIQKFLEKINTAVNVQMCNNKETNDPNLFKLNENAHKTGVLTYLKKLTMEADEFYKAYRRKIKNKLYI